MVAQVLFVELMDVFALALLRGAAETFGRVQVEDSGFVRADQRALVNAGEPAVVPVFAAQQRRAIGMGEWRRRRGDPGFRCPGRR